MHALRVHAFRRALAVALVVAPAAADAQQTVEEGFDTLVTVSNGTRLGSCEQLRARLAAAGALTVGGGTAIFDTAAAADGALLASDEALPATAYRIDVEIDSVDYIYSGGDPNGVVLAAVVDIIPLVQDSTWWDDHFVVAIWVDNSYTDGRDVYVLHWDSSNEIYSWDGSTWQVGWANLTEAFTFAPATPYELRIERTSGDVFELEVTSGGSPVTSASVPLSAARDVSAGSWFLAGDPFTDLYQGTLTVDRIVLPRPGSCVTPDAGVDLAPDVGGPDAGIDAADDGVSDLAGDDAPSDAPADGGMDGADDGDAPADGAPADGEPGGERVTRWDLSAAIPTAPGGEGDDGCGCGLADAPAGAAPWALACLLLALWRRRRRR